MTALWHLRRLRRMSVGEVARRIRTMAVVRVWSVPAWRPDPVRSLRPETSRQARIRLPAADRVDGAAAARVIAAAERLLEGRWMVFERPLDDFGAEPDWFYDASSGRRAPQNEYALRLRPRDAPWGGDAKYVWETSRHQATTLLACAWWLTRDERFATRAASHLQSWWRDNSFLSGIHWTSAIELGLRLLSWSWMRALLTEWPGCAALFDENPVFHQQLFHHQRYIATLFSHGSSANNHLIVELAGLATAATAFPWFAESARWAEWARRRLAEEAEAQQFADGLNREQAAQYHLFVLEALLAAGLAGDLCDAPLPLPFWRSVQRMTDALAGTLDAGGHASRNGDGDDGPGLMLDAPETDRIAAVLGAGAAIFGAGPWWPATGSSATILGGVAALAARPRPIERSASERPTLYARAGQVILRAGAGEDEIWLRCDHGPLGYLSIAAHGHADALSIELRLGGQEVLVDPGTYRFYDSESWRRYFKGTLGHNTLTVDDRDQAVFGGSFLWLTPTRSVLEGFDAGDERRAAVWQARHHGYDRRPRAAVHHRRVGLDRAARQIMIEDWLEARDAHGVILAFHLAPQIACELAKDRAELRWNASGVDRSAVLALPPGLDWRAHRGERNPPLGWYSCSFGHLAPTTVLLGRGALAPEARLRTIIMLAEEQPSRSVAEAQRPCLRPDLVS